jgi:hypothetical protein
MAIWARWAHGQPWFVYRMISGLLAEPFVAAMAEGGKYCK